MQQIQFANRVKKTENRKNKKHVGKPKILHDLDRTPEEILKKRVQKFLECHGYLPTAKSLWKSPLEDASLNEIQGHCPHPFSVSGYFQ